MKWFQKNTESPSESQRQSYVPMKVVRREDGIIDPPYDPGWLVVDRLRWELGVLQADTGYDVTLIWPTCYRNGHPLRDQFGIAFNNRLFACIAENEITAFCVGFRWGVGADQPTETVE